MRTLSRTLLLSAVTLFGATGCLTSRSIGAVIQHGNRNLTLVQTEDTWTYVPAVFAVNKHQFWNCRNDAATLVCSKVCDAPGSDLSCPAQYGAAGGSNTAANTSSK